MELYFQGYQACVTRLYQNNRNKSKGVQLFAEWYVARKGLNAKIIITVAKIRVMNNFGNYSMVLDVAYMISRNSIKTWRVWCECCGD